MIKKILAFFLTAAMLFSVILLASCKEETPENISVETLTPKEKFLKTSENASNYLVGMTQALGLDPTLTPVTEGKMAVVLRLTSSLHTVFSL